MANHGWWKLEDELLVKYTPSRHDQYLAERLSRSLSAIKTKRTAIRCWERSFQRPYETRQLTGGDGS